ncbi:MAG: hypothetical protein A2086_04215 [Spirochaetes bacterium GWD1_27_9]|nr:MAG: hypothetical protein A2Z98_18010 [Spirochaetes bacterium GWB1_27_13]OHD23045.1 MAG: hypothetical protein A2Y34_17850 [Spirochaetes bacterium GWC1_27_15]OHD41363.1 MAG: hypothetical protein A2086_04215 [Spirochaetes bacterium GWD1_27_9]
MEYSWIYWFVAGFILLIIEIITPGFVIGLIGAACFIGGIVAIFTPNIIIQLAVFGVSLVLVFIYVRPIFLKYFTKKDQKKSTVDALIGKICIVDTEIDNVKGNGYIKDGADYWKAKSSDGSLIPKGSLVVIENMEGITATVSLKKD